jgi:FAD/FMN-containing dehydrogenase
MPAVTNWGKFPVVDADMRSFDRIDGLRDLMAGPSSAIARGLGRSYGDASLGPRILSSLRFDKILAFDEDTGVLTCQAGVTLRDLLRVFVPRGWFLPVTPGTKFVTVGGAIAANVHGKNHHLQGGFCDHVTSMDLMQADGNVIHCSHEENADLFLATCGGIGLTGIILHATFRLQPIETAFVREELLEARDLVHIIERFETSSDWTYSVAWIDCLARGAALGRSLLMRGEHANVTDLHQPDQHRSPLQIPAKRTLAVPADLPSWVLNRHSVAAFNALFYWKNTHGSPHHLKDYDTYFYPLDFVHDWNRIYGRNGFVQYQFVVPREAGRAGLSAILRRIGDQGWGSFLAVLKLLGPEKGAMSFPMEGYTLALDFPVRAGLLPFLDELDAMVTDFGGRIYLVKDARMKPETFRRGYPHAAQFARDLRRWDPDCKFRSRMSDRLELTA